MGITTQSTTNGTMAIGFTPPNAGRSAHLYLSVNGAQTSNTVQLTFFNSAGTQVGTPVTLTTGSGSAQYDTVTPATSKIYAAITFSNPVVSTFQMELIAIN